MTEPMNPERFRGDLEGFLAWVEEHPQPFNPTWCARHWAPCPVDGKPGLLASIVLMSEAFTMMPADVCGATGMNSWLANQAEPICCRLGDEKIDWLWDEVDQPHCAERPPSWHPMAHGRVCWKRPRHAGPHEWENPASIFELMPS